MIDRSIDRSINRSSFLNADKENIESSLKGSFVGPKIWWVLSGKTKMRKDRSSFVKTKRKKGKKERQRKKSKCAISYTTRINHNIQGLSEKNIWFRKLFPRQCVRKGERFIRHENPVIKIFRSILMILLARSKAKYYSTHVNYFLLHLFPFVNFPKNIISCRYKNHV